MIPLYMCEICKSTYLSKGDAKYCERCHQPKETMSIKSISYKSQDEYIGPPLKIPEFVTIEFSKRPGDTAVYELKKLGQLDPKREVFQDMTKEKGRDVWIKLSGNELLFEKYAKNDCWCKFDDGTVVRYKDDHPIAIMTHFKLF